MKKIDPVKKEQIESKLTYANARMQSLLSALFNSRMADASPAHLEHEAADIVAAARECLDYLAVDIFDAYIAPAMTNKSADQVAKTRKSVYFPFTVQAMDSETMRVLKTAYPEFHSFLQHAVEKFGTDEYMDNTLLPYSVFPDMKSMVDTKKHHDIVPVQANENGEILMFAPGMQITLNVREQVGWNPLQEVSETDKLVTEYRFSFNNAEVAKFCGNCIWATRYFVRKIYSEFFLREYWYGHPVRYQTSYTSTTGGIIPLLHAVPLASSPRK